MNKKAFIDVETTGLDVNKGHELVQLAILIEVDGKVVSEKQIFARPNNLDKVEAEALKIQGRTLEQIKTWPSRQEAYNKLVEELGRFVDKFNSKDKLIWVGQNAPFDQGFVRALFDEVKDKYFGSWFQQQPVDLISLAVAARDAGLIVVENFKLATLCGAMGIKLVGAHDALADIRATRECYLKLVGLFKTVDQAGGVLTVKTETSDKTGGTTSDPETSKTPETAKA